MDGEHILQRYSDISVPKTSQDNQTSKAFNDIQSIWHQAPTAQFVGTQWIGPMCLSPICLASQQVALGCSIGFFYISVSVKMISG